jgi:hypothetical protein
VECRCKFWRKKAARTQKESAIALLLTQRRKKSKCCGFCDTKTHIMVMFKFEHMNITFEEQQQKWLFL